MNVSKFNITSNLTNNPAAVVPPEYSRSIQHKAISTLATSVLIILTLAGNALVLAAFYTYKRIRRSVTNWFIVSLAIADILVALLTEPFWMSVELTGWMNLPEGIDFKKLQMTWYFLDITCAISSIVNLMFISIDRYFAIKSPLSHHTKMTPDKAKFIIPILWIYSALVASLSSFTTWKWNVLVVFVIGFLFPLIVVIFCYTGILVVISSKRRLSNRGGKRLAKEFKTAKSLGVVTGAFIICWLPFFIVSLLFNHSIEAKAVINKTPAIISSVKWLHYSNSCLNPIIYAFLNPTFKVAFRNLFRRICGKNDRMDHSFSFSFTFGTRKTKSKLHTQETTVDGNITNGGPAEKRGILFQCHRKNPEESRDSTTGSGSEPKDGGESRKKPVYSADTYCREKSFRNRTDCSTSGSPKSLSLGVSSDTPLLNNKASNIPNEDILQSPDSNPKEPLLSNNQQQTENFTFSPDYLEVPECTDLEELVPSNVEVVEVKSDAESKTTSLSSDLDVNLTAQLDPKRNEFCLFVDGVAVPEIDIKSSDV